MAYHPLDSAARRAHEQFERDALRAERAWLVALVVAAFWFTLAWLVAWPLVGAPWALVVAPPATVCAGAAWFAVERAGHRLLHTSITIIAAALFLVLFLIVPGVLDALRWFAGIIRHL